MHLVTVRLTAVLAIAAAFATWSFFGFWLIGTLVLICSLIMMLLYLGRDTGEETDDLKPDLIRQALVLKVLASGVRAGAALGAIVFAVLLMIFAASAFHQIRDGTLTLPQGFVWWLSGPAVAAVICAFCGFCAGSAYYLLMRWPADCKRFGSCTEMQLLHEAAKQKKRLTFAH